MKIKYQLLALTAVLAFCVNCGDDGEQSVIFGTWKSQSITYFNCSDPGNDRNQSCPSDCFILILNDNSDNTYSLIRNFEGNGVAEVGTYTASGSNLELCPVGGVCYNIPIAISGTTMTIEVPSSDSDCTVRTILNRD